MNERVKYDCSETKQILLFFTLNLELHLHIFKANTKISQSHLLLSTCDTKPSVANNLLMQTHFMRKAHEKHSLTSLFSLPFNKFPDNFFLLESNSIPRTVSSSVMSWHGM